MSFVETLKDLEAKGLELWIEGDRLRYRGPKDVLSTEILAGLRQNKDEVCKILTEDTRDPVLSPLSHSQRSLWFLHSLASESAAYNVGFAVRIRSDIDVPALRRALQELITRHATLRTTFPKRDRDPVQEIHKRQELCFEEIDASHWTWDELTMQVSDAYKRPFNLTVG